MNYGFEEVRQDLLKLSLLGFVDNFTSICMYVCMYVYVPLECITEVVTGSL